MDPADLFCELYDQWITLADVNDIDDWRLGNEDAIDALADQIRSTGEVPDDLDHPRDPEHQFVILAGIDLALYDCHPRSGAGSYGALAPLAARSAMTGSYSSKADPGGLVPRWTRTAHPGSRTERLIDAFVGVIRVGPEEWRRLRLRFVPSSHDLPRHAGTSAMPVLVAFAPLLESLDDVRFDSGVGLPGRPDARWYRIGPDTARVEAKLSTLLDSFDSSGAQIALLPEGAANPELLDSWIRLLRARPRPPASRLTWILIGSGPFPSGYELPLHSALLLHRDSGDVLTTHNKFAPFNFADRQTEPWGLADLLGDGSLHEGIRLGSEVEVLESQAGRIALFICEDVTRHGDPLHDAIASAGPSLILVPVFGCSIRPYYWEHQAARRHSVLLGATVAIVNSAVIADAQARKGLPVTDGNICLLTIPPVNPSEDRSVADHFGSMPTTGECVTLPT